MIPISAALITASAMITAGVTGLRDDPGIAEGYLSLSVDNSHFVMGTTRIDRVVAAGPLALGPLIQEMKRRDCSLDTFALLLGMIRSFAREASRRACAGMAV